MSPLTRLQLDHILNVYIGQYLECSAVIVRLWAEDGPVLDRLLAVRAFQQEMMRIAVSVYRLDAAYGGGLAGRFKAVVQTEPTGDPGGRV